MWETLGFISLFLLITLNNLDNEIILIRSIKRLITLRIMNLIRGMLAGDNYTSNGTQMFEYEKDCNKSNVHGNKPSWISMLVSRLLGRTSWSLFSTQ